MAIDVLTEEVAANLEEAAEVTRRLSSKGIGVFLGGVVVGVGIGFYLGHRWNTEKIKAEAFRESSEEIEKMREMYHAKTIAAQEKPAVEEIIAEKGYGGHVPVESSVPPAFIRPTHPPVPVMEGKNTQYIPVQPVQREWDYEHELENRSSEIPYVIHKDEFEEVDNGYIQKALVYYAEDGVLVDDTERPLPHADIVVGLDNLKWGYGSNDPDLVFIRNEHMEMEFEISRTQSSYEREVLGNDHDQSN